MRQEIRPYTPKAGDPPFSPGVKIGDVVFTSGQVGKNPETGAVPEDFREEVRQCMQNLMTVLEASGSAGDRVVKCTCFLTDMKLFSQFNEVYLEFFDPGHLPARSAFGVAELVSPFRVEVEAVAYCG